MPLSFQFFLSGKWIGLLAAILSCFAATGLAQTPACQAVVDRPATAADTAYGDGRYADAESLYQQSLAERPNNAEISAALVRTLLHEDKVVQAAAQANATFVADPHAVASITAMAEVQLRQGQPWLALQTMDAAVAAGRCYARLHLIRSRALRIDSMYASERAELQSAYEIDPADLDIQRAWFAVGEPAHEIEGIRQSLATMKDLNEETRRKAEASMYSMLPLLSENSQNCKLLPSVPSATLPLLPSFADVKHIDGYRLVVEFPQAKGKLLVDSAASGLYISRALAVQNGFHQGEGDPPGTVHVDSVRVGPLEFRDCLAGVSDAPFAGKSDGFIGTDIFASWMITLDYRQAKMTLTPLPKQAGILPGDRLASPELADFTPVYHRRQYLLVPLTFGNKSRKLFILATGMRFSAMTSETAHSLSTMKVNFTNSEQTVQGTKVQFFREVFDLQLANLPQIHQGHILELDPTVRERNTGFQIAGMLGLDVLQPLSLHLDYRDGLAKFESPIGELSPQPKIGTAIAAGSAPAESEADKPACTLGDTTDRSIASTIQAKVTGVLDSAHLKPGEEVWVKVVYGLDYPGCRLDEDAILYGHVTAATASKNPGASELSLVFDHGDCSGKGKKPLTLRLIGLVAPPDISRHIHDVLPTEVAGGGRSIQGATASSANALDQDLNPGGTPNTVHPGIVVRMVGVKLEPEGGPACSARLTSANRSVQLGVGSELILTMLGKQ